MTDLITIYTKKGAEQIEALARWTETVGSGEYEFALHVIPQEGVYDRPLGLSEVSTGASMQASLVHPNGSGTLRENHTKPGHRGYLPAAKLHRLAYLSLKAQIKKVPAERFEQMVGLNLLARAQRDNELEKRAKAEEVQEQKIADEEQVTCKICGDSGVVVTTDLDHEGNSIEAVCPHLKEADE